MSDFTPAYRCALILQEDPQMPEVIREQVSALADQYQWPVLTSCPSDATAIDVCLLWAPSGWTACWLHEPGWKPLRFDFTHPAFLRRLTQAGPRSEMLIKALGRKRPQRAIDCTAGTGEESLLLAAYGLEVTMIERDPVLGVLLSDALSRAADSAHPILHELASRVSLRCDDASEVLALSGPQDAVEVIYCDPMFPPRQKSAQVSKTMQFFNRLLGPAQDAEPLVRSALRVATRRVIVKRPAKSKCLLASPPPDQQIRNKALRFDIYLVHSS
jgi:16S rRNA (guanine1516-N2)-methyltransferase